MSRRRVVQALAGIPVGCALAASTGASPAAARAVPAGAQPAVGNRTTHPPRARRAALVQALDDACRGANVPAFGIAVVDAEGEVLVDARGRLQGLDGNTPFRIGSITKTITALAMLRLAERQAIDLDRTPLRDLAPDASCSKPWEAEAPLTVAMLLEHTAGFGELTRREWDYAAPARISLREGLALDPASRTCRWRPGVQHVYSNASPGLVAWAIECRQPLPYDDFVRAEVLQPLGLQHTGFLPDDASARRLVPGFRADGMTRIPYWHQHILAYGALHASPQDMARLLRTLLADAGAVPREHISVTPSLLRAASMARMLSPRTSLAARAGLALGHGLGIYGSARGGFVFDGHGGDGDGYLSRFGLLRSAGRGYFLVIDTDNPPLFARLRQIVERWLTADLAPLAAPRPAALAAPQPAALATTAAPSQAATLARWAGHYRRAASRFPAPTEGGRQAELEVVVSGQGLQLRGAVTADLLPTGAPGQFRTSAESVATSIFAVEGGELYLLGEPGNFLRTPDSAISR